MKINLERWISEKHYCQNCGNLMQTFYGTGRYCSKSCANARSHSKEQCKKVSESLKKMYENRIKKDLICKKCGKIFHSKDVSRKECFECLPSTIKKVKVNKKPKTILDLSSRTVTKVVLRMQLPCSCCGFYVEGVTLDFHHIIPKQNGGSNSLNNLAYICPNCHRIVHTDPSKLQKNLVSFDKYLIILNKKWEDYYYTK